MNEELVVTEDMIIKTDEVCILPPVLMPEGDEPLFVDNCLFLPEGDEPLFIVDKSDDFEIEVDTFPFFMQLIEEELGSEFRLA